MYHIFNGAIMARLQPISTIARVKKAFDRYISADKAGKRSGKPRFKGRGRYHSFTYTQMPQDCIKGNRITLSKIGDVKIIKYAPPLQLNLVMITMGLRLS